MLIRLLLNIFALFLKIALWVVITFAVIPLGIFILFLYIFPDLAHDGSLQFWAVFTILNIVASYFLWKPVHWVVTTITAPEEVIQVTKQLES